MESGKKKLVRISVNALPLLLLVCRISTSSIFSVDLWNNLGVPSGAPGRHESGGEQVVAYADGTLTLAQVLALRQSESQALQCVDELYQHLLNLCNGF